jgi:hypothetical protein
LSLDLGDGTFDRPAPFLDAVGLFSRSGREALGIGGKAGSETEEGREQLPLRIEPSS